MTIKNTRPLYGDGEVTPINHANMIDMLETTATAKQESYLKIINKFVEEKGTDKKMLLLIGTAFIELEGYKLAITALKDMLELGEM